MKVTKEVIKIYEQALEHAKRDYAMDQEYNEGTITVGLCYYIFKYAPKSSYLIYKRRQAIRIYETPYITTFKEWCKKERLITVESWGYWWPFDDIDSRIKALSKYIEYLKTQSKKQNNESN